jgi:hypothetical protein
MVHARVTTKFTQISHRVSAVKEIMVLREPQNPGGREGVSMYVTKKEKRKKDRCYQIIIRQNDGISKVISLDIRV